MTRVHDRERVAILGGSFDPVHRGHLAMAEAARAECSLDRLLFLPCFVSPHKSGTVATTEQRVEMLQLALRDVAQPGGEVSCYEVDREGPSYSWETIVAFSSAEPDTEWFWIVGTDQWNSLHRWARPEVLQEKLHFIVCTRGNEELVDRPGWRSTVIEFSHPASSTAIRNHFEGHVDWLTPRVVEFCREEELYQKG